MLERSGVISEQDFAHLGVTDIAYVKRVVRDGQIIYLIHAADGAPMGVAHDRDAAMAAVRQRDLDPVSVH